LNNALTLKEERTKLFQDIYDGIIPKRVPRNAGLSVEFAMEYAGLPLAETQYTLEGVEEAFEKICRLQCMDAHPIGFVKPPLHWQILGSQSFQMSSNGFVQHPEFSPMQPDEYDELIANPLDFFLEKIHPRVYTELDTDPVTRTFIFAAALKANEDHMNTFARISDKLAEKYGFFVPPKGTTPLTFAPFDYLANWLRGFTGVCIDIRRYPEKVIEACEAILAMLMRSCIPEQPSRYGHTLIPLHMAPYLNEKDFEKFYWPTLYKMIWALAEAGQPARIACEHDWMRYLDYLQELPPQTRLIFEFGDPKLVKEKLGKKFIITGFYPLTLLQTGTKEQCLDKAKELLDILAPGGNYIFGFDKGALTLNNINLENYLAVMNYIGENAYYDNAGESSLDFTPVTPPKIDILPLTSKYDFDWEAYKKRHPNFPPHLEPLMKKQMEQYRKKVIEFLSY